MDKGKTTLEKVKTQMPLIDDLRKITCSSCDKSFYVEIDESPCYCPHCREYTEYNPEFVTTHKCSLTGATFTRKEANEIGQCGALGGIKQACINCSNVLEK